MAESARLAISGLALSTLLAACPQSITTRLENRPGDASSPSSDSGQDGRDAESLPDGNLPRDGSVLDGGSVDPALSWGRMTLPANTNIVRAIWGRSDREVYAGTGNGKLLFFDGSGWSVVWSDPGNHQIEALWGTSDRLFVASMTTLHVHEGAVGSSVSSFPVGSMVRGMHGRNNSEVYLVSDQYNGRGFYLYDGSELRPIVEPTDISTLESVFSASDGATYVGGNGAIFRYDGSTFSEPEAVEWPTQWTSNDRLLFVFQGITEVGGRVFAFGSQQLVFERDSARVWRRIHEPNGSSTLEAGTGFVTAQGVEMYLAGEEGDGGPILRFLDGGFFPDQTQTRAHLLDLWAAGPNRIFAAGFEPNTFNGIVLLGARD